MNKHPYLNIEYFGILVDESNASGEKFSPESRKIRQAINYGFDRRKMMMYLRNSIGIPAESGFVPAGLPSFDSVKVKGYYYDPAMPRQLLSEAGLSGWKRFAGNKIIDHCPFMLTLQVSLRDELEDVGIKIQVEAVQKSLLLEQTAKSQAIVFQRKLDRRLS